MIKGVLRWLANNLHKEYSEMFNQKTQAKVLKDIIEDSYDERFKWDKTKGGKE